VRETRWATLDPASFINVAGNITLLPTFYLCIHAAFNGVSALIGALTPAESGRKDEEEMKCCLSYNPFIRVIGSFAAYFAV
jgi:hypothetical protein